MTDDNNNNPLKMAQAMVASGIAADRNNPLQPKPITGNALIVLKRRYLMKDPGGNLIEDTPGMFTRVAVNLSQADGNYTPLRATDLNPLMPAIQQFYPNDTEEDTETKFYNVMARLLFIPNSPTLMNAGGRLQQLAACFVLPVEDSLDHIFEGVKQTALIHKSGGGTGFSFSRLRPKGDIVGSTGGVASGPVGFIRAYDVATDVVKQGGTRRGANMAVLRVDHPDIEEFIHVKDTSQHLQNFNISVAVTDDFMHAVETGAGFDLINPRTSKAASTADARSIWDQIINSAHLTGDPGLIFIDQINRHNTNHHLGPIEAVNPCVTADTLVYTKQGLITIDNLWSNREDPQVVVDGRFDQHRFQQAGPVMATGVKPVYKLITTEGYQIRLTADHQVMTENGWTQADRLQPGDRLHILNRKGGFGPSGDHATGTLLGWLSARNTLEPDQALLPFISGLALHREFPNAARSAFQGTTPKGQAAVALATKHTHTNNTLYTELKHAAARYGLTKDNADRVPPSVFQGTEPMQRGYLQALFTADTNLPSDNDQNLTLTLKSQEHALDVQRLLLNFNVFSRSTPNPVPPLYDVVLSGQGIRTLAIQIGLLNTAQDHALKTGTTKAKAALFPNEFKATFESLLPDGEEDVYDLTEPQTHSFIANGLVVHNCGEQVLRPNEACNLGSINLARMVHYNTDHPKAAINYPLIKETCRTAVHMLDNVIDMNNYPSETIGETTRSTRRIGVGVMGFADMLIQLGVPYDSDEAGKLARDVMRHIQSEVHAASADLALARSTYPLWDGSTYSATENPNHPSGVLMRNTAPVTIAPTGTISIIAGASSGIEPLFALCFTRTVMDGTKLFEVNPYFEAAAKHHGFYSEDLMEQVALTGSIQNTDSPDWAKQVFKVASDISPEAHVQMQAAFQEHTDNAVSKTINFPHEATPDEIRRAYMLAFKLGCKGITVYRDGSKDNQVLTTKQTATASQHPDANGTHPITRERPRVMNGFTERFRTGHGNLYVTLNLDNQNPFEMFARLGKAGGCDSAQQEAICRLISMALRANIPPEEIIDNLQGITCCPNWDDGKQILSVPDALAQCLMSYVLLRDQPSKDPGTDAGANANPYADTHHDPDTISAGTAQQLPLTPAPAAVMDLPRTGPGPRCPDCSSLLVFQEGCNHCSSPICGWSDCK